MNTALSPLAGRVAFVLVAPSHPGNIGSAARAIKTMGFTDLRVVAPKVAEYRTHPEAIALSTTSVDVLEHSRDYATLTDALEDVALSFAIGVVMFYISFYHNDLDHGTTMIFFIANQS